MRTSFKIPEMRADRRRLEAALSSLLFLALVAPAQSQAEKQTVIHARIDEKHDRLTPDLEPDIEWIHEFTITLAGRNEVSESQTNTFAGSAMHPATVQRAAKLRSENERNAALGQSGGKVVWQVIGPKKLRRIATGKQYIVVFDIDIDESDNCRIDAKYLRQSGFEDVVMKRAGTGEMEHFSIPRVVSATCSIQAS